jgi:hypothetical protein
MTYSTEVRGERGLSILVPTTGDRWPSLLEHFHDGYPTNGMKFTTNTFLLYNFMIRFIRTLFILDNW